MGCAVTIFNWFCQLGHRLLRQPNAYPQYATGSSWSSALPRTKRLRFSPRGLTAPLAGRLSDNAIAAPPGQASTEMREPHLHRRAAARPRLPHETTPLVSGFLKRAVSPHGSPEVEPIRAGRQAGQRREEQQGQEMSRREMGPGQAGAGEATLACCSRASAIHSGRGAAPLLPAGFPLSGPSRNPPARDGDTTASLSRVAGLQPPLRRHFLRGRGYAGTAASGTALERRWQRHGGEAPRRARG